MFGNASYFVLALNTDPNRAEADDVESNAPAPDQGTAPSESRPVTIDQGEGAREAFLHMMNEWYVEFVRTNPTTQPPPPLPIPQPVPVAPQGMEFVRLNKPPVDKIRKQGAEDSGPMLMMIQSESSFGLKTPSGYLMTCLAHRMNV
ncbi:Chaperone surA [Gossypium australe]|uniref:Chaperone surA n=1 Tax=Gossypium australe TaxID=47621 RepID=A0A5B6WZX1_9ROSI|nr:Chaperone surA [Gossypium australe]